MGDFMLIRIPDWTMIELLITLGFAFFLQHKVGGALDLKEGSLLERLFTCSFCVGFWVGALFGLGTFYQLSVFEGLTKSFALGFANGLAFFYLETWAAAAEIRRLRDEEQIGFLRRQKALADRELSEGEDEE